MEFDIRIGTLLDTSKAEAQLQEFINKYGNGDNDFKINLKISGDEKLEGIEKSLNNIKSLAKSISNIKIDFDGENLSVDTNVKETVKRTQKEMQDATKDVANQIGNGVEQAVKETTKGLEKSIDDVQKKIKAMISNLENLKLNPFADAKEIDNMIASLNNIGSADFEKFGNLGLDLAREEIESITKAYDDLVKTAKNKQLDDIFQTTKVEPLRQQILALKEVLDFKNMDTSSLDKLLQDLKKTSEYGDDLKKAKSVFADVKNSFSNISKSMGEKGITSAETAIKRLLEYKEKLQEQIRMELDTSKIQKAEADIKRIDDAIERLKVNSDESIVKNLFDMSELKNMENMEKASKTLKANMEKLEGVFDKLKTKTTQLSQLEFVDIASLTAVQSYIKDIEKSIKSLDFDNLKANEINQVKEDLETLEACIKSVQKASERMELEVDFASDLEKATRQLNGLESALVKLGYSTKGLEDLKEELKSIDNLAKADLGMATANLERLSESMREFGRANNLGDISGSSNQFVKYVNEIVASTKKLLTIKDVEFASAIKEEIDQTISALHQLMKTFDETERENMSDFYAKALDGLSEKFTQEINKIQSEADKLNTSLYKIGRDIDLNDSIDSEKLVDDFNQAVQKVEELQNALRQANSMKMDIEGIERLKGDLEEAKNSVQELARQKIELDCNQAIQRAEELKREFTEVDEVLDRLGGTDAINRIVQDFQNGVTTFDKATASLKKFENALDGIENSSGKISKSFDGFEQSGSKIEGIFNSISDAFSTFTLGALIEEGIENLAYGITETITGLDAAMTELRRVSDGTGLTFDNAGYKQTANEAREVAISVGQSTEDVIKGMSTALQAGATTIEQATSIARTSALLQNVSDMGADEASQAIASMVNQYYSMDTALSKVQDRIKGAPADYNNLTNAIDMVNYAGNNWAISSQGVAEALQNGGAVLSNYGITLSDSIAMISSANESLQDPARIGNGLRSLAVNFAGIKANAKTGNLELNKSAKALQEIAGIDIFTDKSKTSVKDMMTLMDEVNDKWDTLSDTQQKGLSEALAGKTQAAVFQSLMTGWDRVRQFQQEYKEGFMIGSAEKENAAYLDSIAGKWNQLKENMKALLTNNVSIDFIKGALDGANKLIEVIDKVISKLGTIGTLGAIGGIASFIKSMKNFSNITGISSGLIGLFNAFGKAGNLGNIGNSFNSLVQSSGLAKTALIGFDAVLKGIGWGILIAGIVGAIKAWDNYAHATENAIEASKERQQGYQDEAKELGSQISSLSRIAKEYDTLANKTNKTAEEFARFKELQREIAEIAPGLVQGYDVNGDPILALTDNLQEYINKLQEARKEKIALSNVEADEQARLYLNDEDDTKKYKEAVQKALDARKEQDLFNTKGTTAKNSIAYAKGTDIFTQLQEIQQEVADKNAKLRQEMMELNEEYVQADNTITTSLINNLGLQSKAYQNLGVEGQAAMNQFIGSLDLGDFTQEQASQLNTMLGKMAECSTSFESFSQEQRNSIMSAQQAYESGIGSIDAYGEALLGVFEETGKIDLSSLNEYISGINTEFQNTGNLEQYQQRMQGVARTLSELTGIDYDTIYKGLRDGFNEQIFSQNADALQRYLDKNKKAIEEYAEASGQGLEKANQVYEEKFSSLSNFLNTAINQGGFNIEGLKQAYDDLPKQIQNVADAVLKDNELTEFEQKLMTSFSIEVANEGEITDQTITQLQQLLDGTFEGETIEIGGIKFGASEFESIKQVFNDVGWSAQDLKEKLKDNGFDDIIRDANELKNALDSLNFSDKVKKAFGAVGFESMDGVNAMRDVIAQIEGEEVQLKFIADNEEFFRGAKDVQDAVTQMINAGKGHELLKLGIKVEGHEEFTRVQNAYNALPKSVQTLVNTKVIGYENVEKVRNFLTEEGASEKTITTLMKLEGADEVLSKSSSYKEFLEGMQGLVVNTSLNAEVTGEEELEEVTTTIKNADGTTSNVTVQMDTDAKEKYDLITGLLKALEGSETETKVDANTKPAEEKLQAVNQSKEEVEGDVEFELLANGETVRGVIGETITMKNEAGEDVTFTITADNTSVTVTEEVNGQKQELKEGVDFEVTANGSQAKQEVSTLITEKGELGKPVNTLMTIMVDGRETVQAAINEKGQLEVNGQAKTHVYVEGLGQYSIAINDKGQLEVDGVAQTHVQVKNGEQLQIAKNEKGQLEVNGQAVTDVKVNGAEKAKETKKAIEEIPDKKESSVSIKFDVNDAIDSVLSRLGLNKKKETIEITVKAVDQASSTLDKINGYNDKTVTFTVKCSGASEALSQVQSLSTTPISNKQFSIICNGGTQVSAQLGNIASRTLPNKTFSVTANTATVSSQLNAIATRTIPNKTFQITCNDSASAKISAVAGRQIPTKTFSVICNDQASAKLNTVQNKKVSDKKFTINCTDNASAKVSAVQSKKINNKSFTVSCKDSASSKLNSIISKLGAIRSKSVTVTTTYRQIGKPASAGGSSVSQPQVVEMGTAIPMVVDSESVASTMSIARTTASAVNQAMASTQANYTDTILASQYWANQQLDHDLDLLQDYAAQLDRIASKLDVVGAKIDTAFGSTKANLLKEQITLLQQQQAMLKKEQADVKTLAGNYKNLLKNQGFKVDANGAVTNGTSKILELEHALEKAQKAQDAYTGDNKTKQNSLAKAVKNAQDKLEKAKNTLDQYYDMSNKVAETEAEWREIASAIKEAKNAIYEANKEQANFYKEAKTVELEYSYDKLSDQLDILQSKMDLERNKTNTDLIKEEINLLKQMQRENEKVEASYRNQTHYYENYLSGKGFKFNANGDITNAADALNKNKSSEEIESIQDAYESYMELIRDTIPDLEKEWWDLEKSMEDANQKMKEMEEEAKRLAEELKKLSYMKQFDHIEELSREQEKLEAQMDKLNDLMDLSDGDANKVKSMKDQIELLKEQITLQQNITNQLNSQQKSLQNLLKADGFKFDSNGDISNADSLLAMAQTMDEYEEIKEKIEEYYDVQDQILDSEDQWREYQKSIKETEEEIEALKYEIKEMKKEANLKEFENDLQIINNELEKLQAIGDLSGTDTLSNLEQQLKVIKKQQSATEELLDYQKKQVSSMKDELKDYGFNLNEDGTIDNTANQLEYLKEVLSDSEFERINEVLEEYFDVALSEIPDLETQLIEYQRDYQDILEQKLEATEKIEEEITKILEKQVDDRIEEIEKEKDAQIDSLNKQKEAYQKWREGVDYENDYDEQLAKVQELQAQLEIAQRDDSLSGQKRVADLMEQLKEEQKALEDLVQDRIDNQINDMFDKQIEDVENDASKQIESLEEVFSESKIAEMVAEAIQTGLFTDIEGNVSSLDTALMDMANNSVEYMGVMGESLKTELLNNLNVALETMSQINQINKELGNGFSMDLTSTVVNVPATNFDSVAVKGAKEENNITLGDMVINVDGNVTEDSIYMIEDALKQQRIQIINEIMANVK